MKSNAEDTVRAAIEILDFMLEVKEKTKAEGKPFFEILIGCSTGPILDEIVEIEKLAYNICGDTKHCITNGIIHENWEK